jgi:hypothetical protein
LPATEWQYPTELQHFAAQNSQVLTRCKRVIPATRIVP